MIDAENISYKDLPEILNEIPRHGEIILKAIYGNWQNPTLQKWYQLAQENQFKIRQQPANTKNAADIKLMLDAMDVLHHIRVDVFCLVTNDADYIHICHKLREFGKYIMGVGYQHAAEAFIRACDTFIFIGRDTASVRRATEVPKQPATATKATDQTIIRNLLSEAFASTQTDGNGWVSLALLGNSLVQVQPGFKTQTYGHATLTKLLQTMPDFVDLRKKSARLKNDTHSKQSYQDAIQTLLSEAFAETQTDDNGWVDMSALGTALRKVQPDFNAKTYGYATLAKLLQSMSSVVELRAEGKTKKLARLKHTVP